MPPPPRAADFDARLSVPTFRGYFYMLTASHFGTRPLSTGTQPDGFSITAFRKKNALSCIKNKGKMKRFKKFFSLRL